MTTTRTCKLVLEDPWGEQWRMAYLLIYYQTVCRLWSPPRFRNLWSETRTRTRTWGLRTRTRTCKLVLEDLQGLGLSSRTTTLHTHHTLFCDICKPLKPKIRSQISAEIFKDYTSLTNNGKMILFCWIPSHVNIAGSDKQMLWIFHCPSPAMKLSACDLIHNISKFCLAEWQHIWNSCPANNWPPNLHLA